MGIILQLFAAVSVLAGIGAAGLGFVQMVDAFRLIRVSTEASAVQVIQLYDGVILWFVAAIVLFVFAAVLILEHIAISVRKK